MTADITTFAESELSDEFKMLPVHKVILKAIHGIPLDDKVEFTVTDWRRENPRQFTEKTYLEYLYASGRASVRSVEGQEFGLVVLCLGRRGGDAYLMAVLAAYAALQVTSGVGVTLGGPKGPLGVTIVSPLRFRELQSMTTRFFEGSPTLRSREIAGPGGLWFGPGSGQGREVCVAFRSGARVFHSRSQRLVVLDGVASHIEVGGNPGAREMYYAMAPLTHPNGKVVLVSQPGPGPDFFRDTFMRGMATKEGVLCLQIPSWEINPFIPAAFYESVHADDPRWFWQEYGAEFTNPGVGP